MIKIRTGLILVMATALVAAIPEISPGQAEPVGGSGANVAGAGASTQEAGVANAANAGAAPAAGNAATIEDLQKRITELEAWKNAELNKQPGSGGDKVPVTGAGTEKKDESKKKDSWTNLGMGIEFYGYIKLDAAWDSSRIDQGDYARWVESEQGREDDAEFNMTANQTRIGFRLYGPDLGTVKTGGLFEMDFYGGGDENKPNPMMRKAYLTVNWTSLDLAILAGQDSDLMSPLFPETVNYTIQWWAGNIGYRRPQFRLTKGFDLGDSFRLELAGAALRTVGDKIANSPGDTGEDAGFPTAQGRVGLSLPLLTSTATTVGCSGHWGQEEYDFDASNNHKEFDTWSVNVDATIPIAAWLRLKGEGFLGENLDAYLGGIGNGVTIFSSGNGKSVNTYGGWATVSLGPFGGFRFNAGASVDNPDNQDLATGMRKLNRTYFGNCFFKFYQNIEVALEISYWRTDYKNLEDGDAIRVQTAMILTF